MISSIDDVIDRMQSIADSVGPHDGVGSFNMVYQRTTEAIRQRLGTGFFDDDRFMERFDIVFANRYFAAVDADAAGRRIDTAWRPLFVRRSDRRVHAVQFAVAGMNTTSTTTSRWRSSMSVPPRTPIRSPVRSRPTTAESPT